MSFAVLTGCATSADDTGVLSGEGPHQLRNVDPSAAPSVSLAVTADEHGGWNVHVDSEDFTFTPEQISGPARAHEGHAHLFIDGVKYTRIYSEWSFLPAAAIPPGTHMIDVTLNANDHTTWATNGKPVSASTTVTSASAQTPHTHAHTHQNADVATK